MIRIATPRGRRTRLAKVDPSQKTVYDGHAEGTELGDPVTDRSATVRETLPTHRARGCGSVTLMIQKLREAGDDAAAHQIYQRYFEQLVNRLRQRVNGKVRSSYDSADSAHHALQVVLSNLIEGRFPDLDSRDSLWGLLVAIGDRDVKQAYRKATAAMRDVRRNVAIDSMGGKQDGEAVPFDIEHHEIDDSTLERIEEMVAYLSSQFTKKEYHDILLWELMGYTPAEMKQAIEEKLGCKVYERTLRRWRTLMRAELMAAFPEGPPDV